MLMIDDKAQDPDNLSDLQKSRSLDVVFAQADCVKMRFSILAPGGYAPPSSP